MLEDDARQRLASYREIIAKCVKAGWQRWKDLSPSDRYPLSSRSRATVVYDFICHEIRHAFSEVPGVNIMKIHGMLVLNFNGEIILRFKKLDSAYRTGNIRTRHQESYSLQLQLPHLPPQATRLVAGYQLDRLQVDLKDIQVTHPIGRNVMWHFSILDQAESPQVLLVPEMPDQPFQPTSPPRVRAKSKKPSGE